jgi:hypothetical protein
MRAHAGQLSLLDIDDQPKTRPSAKPKDAGRQQATRRDEPPRRRAGTSRPPALASTGNSSTNASTPDAEDEPINALATALAPRLAAELARRLPAATTGEPRGTTRLLTLDQLIAELPPAKRPQTWKRWLYERTRRGKIPGCVKLGGMLFFERESALAWLRAGAPESG